MARLTIEFYRRNYIEGLFLSSAIYLQPDHTMDIMLKTVEILRRKYLFNGYIHLKLIPGTSKELIERAFKLADRVSSNLELPTVGSLRKLAPDKNFSILLEPLRTVRELYEDRKRKSPASTQVIVGATPDTDRTIIELASKLYEKKLVRRVYYSAYIPVNFDPALPELTEPPFLREHRLYQADWLIRFYGFKTHEIFEDGDNLPLDIDPKLSWALRHPEFFPVDLSKASFEEIVRVPGIGPKSAVKIIKARKYGSLSEEAIRKLGISIKRAKYFITIKGRPLVRPKKRENLAPLIKQESLFPYFDGPFREREKSQWRYSFTTVPSLDF